MMRALAKKPVTVLVAVLMLVTLVGGPAQAHVLHTKWRWVWQEPAVCEKAYNETSHGKGGGYFKQSGERYTQFGTWQCYWPEAKKQRVRIRVWKWDGSSWNVCLLSSPYIRVDQRIWVYYNRTYPPCGNGWYTSDGTSKARHNGRWKGDWIQLWHYSSEWTHHLPA